MDDQQAVWNVAVRVAGSLKPILSQNFTGRAAKQDAYAFAARQAAQIKANSWSHRVVVAEVIEGRTA